MDAIADILMAAGALGAAAYCLILARRLRRFTDLEKGVGGAVAVLSAQVDDLSKMLARAERRAADSAGALASVSDRAEAAGRKLELLVAAMHDLPGDAPAAAPPVPAAPVADPAPTPRATVFLRNSDPMGRRQ